MATSTPHRSSALCRRLLDIAFTTLLALALPACVLTTWAYFFSQPVLFAQLSPFRLQYAVILMVLATVGIALRHFRGSALLLTFALFNAWAILRDVPAGILRVHETSPPPARILLANVLTSNREPNALLHLIKSENPELVALLEVDRRWLAHLEPALEGDYPHRITRPRDDNFGCAVFSRHPLEHSEILAFVDPELPSVAFTFAQAGRPIRVLLTHPLPPGSTKSVRMRDRQLVAIGEWVSARQRGANTNAEASPMLVLGDLNATPWCPPLRRLLASTGLRRAPSEYFGLATTTWPVSVPFLRIPLDHALRNEAITFTACRIGPDIGSDHFPLLIEVALTAPFPPISLAPRQISTPCDPFDTPSQMKKWLVAVLLIATVAWWLHEPAATWRGLPAFADPRQDTLSLPPPFQHGNYTITPLARYGLTAVVLGQKRYRHDPEAKLAPVDLALGWGPMSAAQTINELKISQSGRWYEYRWDADGPPLEPESIARHSANTHCLPSTPEIRKKLLRVQRHQLVALSGYLVEITGPDDYRWRSSLSRDDVAGGSCEVLWITALECAPITP